MESMEERVHVYPQLNGKPSPKQGDGSHTYSRGGVALLLGDEKNQGECRTKRVLCLAQSKGGIVTG